MTSILSLDTTSKHASISLSSGTEIICETNFSTGGDLSASLLPAIEFLLRHSSLKLEDIDVFGIGIGPGLFTGIRVGLATLKGFLTGKQKPVAPVVTLEALACKCTEPGSPVVSMIDARRNEIYVSVYTRDSSGVLEILSPRLIPVSQLEDHLAGLGFSQFQFTGSGTEVYPGFLEERFKSSTICRRSPFLAPEICKIALQRYQAGTTITDLQRLKPLYIRKPDAEQNLLKNR
ncbi:MAG: tRNA (adenosine(37)-N6)-threonylcarbamoyltransferase complex dimerization subunit type 1 TsaB [bacterium]|nr:tRNA (adenosine(37)-N6)-threonylcarbamoyltransferase complex dimerization subunit type 1 TsaB [bacterium]